MENKKYYIVVSNYSLENSKRQPWYTVKHLKEVILQDRDVKVVSSFSEINDSVDSTVIKFWSMKDLLHKPDIKGKLIYLMSFPLYSPKDLLKKPIKLWENRKDLWKIFLVSLVPKFWILRRLELAEKVIFNSDRAFDVFGSNLSNAVNYYPYFKGNWGEFTTRKPKDLSECINVGYFGPPFTSRGIDDVITLINKVNSPSSIMNFKLVVRTEREELEKKLNFYRKKIKILGNVDIVEGFLTRDCLYEELQELDVIVLPFSFVFSELPIVVLEAIELNKLVLTTRDSGLHNLIDGLPCCDLIDIDSIKSEADLLELIRGKYNQKTLGNNSIFNKIDEVSNELRKELCRN